MGYVSCDEAAKKIGVTVRRMQQMCKDGEVSGVLKKRKSMVGS